MKELLIYSDIGEQHPLGFFEEGITTAFIKGELDSAGGEDITVRINSAGGDVFEGLGIYNVLDQYPGNVSVFVDGLAASSASVIAMAGAEIYMAENALMMIHDPYTMAVGSADDMRETADLLDKVKGSIVTTYLSRSNESEESISNMMLAETWLDSVEAVAMGFATHVTKGGNIAASLNRPWIRNEPPKDKIHDNIDSQTMWRISLNRRRLNLID